MSNIILSTNDYSLFKFFEGNREISHWPKIAESINKKDMTPYCPIIVNADMKIIDGQGRFMACKNLKIPVHYVIAPDLIEDDIVLLNTGQKNWAPNDYLNFYVKKGLEPYILVHKFLQSHPLWIVNDVLITRQSHGIKKGKSTAITFKSGNYPFSEDDYKRADEIYQVYKAMTEYTAPGTVKHKGSIVGALSTIQRQGIDMAELEHKIKTHGYSMNAQADQTSYINEFERIYNRNRRGKYVPFAPKS